MKVKFMSILNIFLAQVCINNEKSETVTGNTLVPSTYRTNDKNGTMSSTIYRTLVL